MVAGPDMLAGWHATGQMAVCEVWGKGGARVVGGCLFWGASVHVCTPFAAAAHNTDLGATCNDIERSFRALSPL